MWKWFWKEIIIKKKKHWTLMKRSTYNRSNEWLMCTTKRFKKSFSRIDSWYKNIVRWDDENTFLDRKKRICELSMVTMLDWSNVYMNRRENWLNWTIAILWSVSSKRQCPIRNTKGFISKFKVSIDKPVHRISIFQRTDLQV